MNLQSLPFLISSLVCLCASVLLVGCFDSPSEAIARGELSASDTTSSPDGLSGGLDGDNTPNGDRSAYPAGPFGTEEGQLLANHSFINHDGEPFSLGMIHADASQKLLLITTSAGWCTACIKEQPHFEELFNQYKSQGLAVMVSLFEDADFVPATAGYADSWREQFGLTFHVVADPEFVFADYYNTTLTPMVMVVDVATMTIIWKRTGADINTIEGLIKSNL